MIAAAVVIVLVIAGYIIVRHLGRVADRAEKENTQMAETPTTPPVFAAPAVMPPVRPTTLPDDEEEALPTPAPEDAMPAPVPVPATMPVQPRSRALPLVRGYTAAEVKDRMNQRSAENERTGRFVPFPVFGLVMSCKKDIRSEADKWLSDAGIYSYAQRGFLKGKQKPEDLILAVNDMLPELKRRGADRIILFYYGPQSALTKILELLLTVADVQVMEYVHGKGYQPGFVHYRS
ncbi:MAG: hypothetical protein GC134_01465 [Proteobacteria bacterium]|nr:hypothetical protein [Pseudomonadota bacterium]